MKYILISLLLVLVTTSLSAQANTVDIGIFNVPVGSNTFEVRIRPTQNLSGNLSGAKFTVRHLTSYGVNMSVVSTPYNFSIQASGTSGSYSYYALSMATIYAVTWNMNQEYTVATIQHSSTGSGTGIFELVTNDAWTNSHNGNYYVELNLGDAQKGFYNTQASAPLPVELTTFQANLLPNRTVALDWQSESESGLSHYAIEHSTDGVKFSEIGKVTAKGDVQQVTKYNFKHINPQVGKNYYRLRMVDRSTAFQYSSIQTVLLEEKRNDFSLRPTPTTGPLTLISQNLDQYPAGLKYQLTDNTGKLLQTDRIINDKTDFNLSNYTSGIYFLTIFTEQEQVKQFKVVVTKS